MDRSGINGLAEKVTGLLDERSEASELLNRVDHPSQRQFVELLADQIIAGMTKEKPCPYEPAGKVCDHCSMCNSIGF
jgi:hypothetical protein